MPESSEMVQTLITAKVNHNLIEILSGLAKDDGIDHFPSSQRDNYTINLPLFLEKCSKDLQRLYIHLIIARLVIPAKMVQSSLSETEEPEHFAWYVGNLEVHSRKFVVQVVVVVSTINFCPRVPVI